jgi:hypothetical protein
MPLGSDSTFDFSFPRGFSLVSGDVDVSVERHCDVLHKANETTGHYLQYHIGLLVRVHDPVKPMREPSTLASRSQKCTQTLGQGDGLVGIGVCININWQE